MRYWVFQNNQVLGPYEPADLRGTTTLTTDTLVCPEGRKGTNMGDWLKAGSIPELFSVPAPQPEPAKVPEPAPVNPEVAQTLKEIAALRGLPERLSSLEDAVHRLEEDSRARGTEFSALRQTLDNRLNTPDSTEELRSRLSELEKRLEPLSALGPMVQTAQDASRRIERAVEEQGAALSSLSQELAVLREKLLPAAPPPPIFPEPAPSLVAKETSAIEPPSTVPILAAEPPGSAPSSSEMFSASVSAAPLPPPLASFSEPVASPLPAATPPPSSIPASQPRRRRALLIGGGLGAAALISLLFLFSGRSKRTEPSPETAETSAPQAESGAPAPGAPQASQPSVPTSAASPAEPTPDPRQLAIEIARAWPLPDGHALGATLENLSPPQGALSPWMAEPVNSDRLQVNYFAKGSAAGAPTVAYEFEVSLGDRNVMGRNDAAKAVLAGMASVPPAPPEHKAVKVKKHRKKKTSAPSA